MISLALTLILIGAIDLIAGGLTAYAHPGKWKTYLALTFLLSLVASAAYYLNTSNWGISLAFMAVVFVGSSSWVIARGRSERAWLIFAVLMLVATFVVVALVIPAFAIENEITWLKAHLQRLPWKWYTDNSEGWLILLIGVLLFLGSTSNGVVRCVLQIARGDRIEESEANLKGGRFIGPIERVLIFGLALSGEPTAAALVISAKSIIRFPELRSLGERSSTASIESGAPPQGALLIDDVTEYFLLGSLLSWGLALAVSILF